MYKLYIQIMLITLLLTTSACSIHSKKIWYKSTDALIEQQNYNKALEQLKTENNNERHTKVLKESKNASKKILKSTYVNITNKQWGAAKEKIEFLESHFPREKSFAKLRDDVISGEAEEQRIINTRLALARLNVLNTKQARREFELRKNNTRHPWPLTENILKHEKSKLSQTLYQLSLKALDQQDYINAQKTYSEALKLNPLLNKHGLSVTINDKINKKNHDSIKSKQALLLSELHKAVHTKEFDKTIKLHRILSKAPFSGKAVKSGLKQAMAARIKEATFLDSQASTDYRLGNLDNAIKLWTQAKILNPYDTEYHNKITRASKVQSKLIKLRQQN